MGLTPFQIQVHPGERSVRIDGVDVSHLISRVSIDSPDGEIPKVYLELNGSGSVEGEGIVHVVQDGLDPAAVVAWLDGLDPGQLEKAMLEDADFGETTGELAVRALKGMLGGD